MNDEKDRPIRDTATVIVQDTVDGTKRRRKRGGPNVRRAITDTIGFDKVDAGVLAAAKKIRKAGQVIVVESPTCVLVVNKGA